MFGMGKSRGKGRDNYCKEKEAVINEAIRLAPNSLLIKIGKIVCSSDFAVQYYYNNKHSSFYKDREKLEKAIRRAHVIGAFNHRDIIIDELDEEGIFDKLKNNNS